MTESAVVLYGVWCFTRRKEALLLGKLREYLAMRGSWVRGGCKGDNIVRIRARCGE